MPDTFIHFKCIKNDESKDNQEPNFWSHKFVYRHETQEQLKEMFNKAVAEVWTMGGAIVVKDERKRAGDLNNVMFIPLHMMARIEFETREVTGRYPDPEEATKQ